MNDREFHEKTMMLPEWLIVDVPEVTRSYRVMFNNFAEYAFHLALVALMDNRHYRHGVHKATNRLFNQLVTDLEARQDLEYDENGFKNDLRPMFMEHLVAFEQGVNEIRKYLDELKVCVWERYMPYDFQSLLPSGELLLQRVTNLAYLQGLVEE